MKKSLFYDSSGRLVQQTQISGKTHTLNLQSLEKGLYHVKLISEEFNLCEKLVVK
ncbi:MAG: T9SS type A sorting domain-containing protein [Bacteroidota bacterium]